MARIRTVKPELWTDPEFVECSPNARLLFVAALNFASDYGVLPDKPKQLRMQCLPADDVSIDDLVTELVEHGFWERRTAPDGAKVLVIRTFTLHQKVDKPTVGRWGDPATWTENIDESSPSPPRVLSESSPTEGKGREGITLVADSREQYPFVEWWAKYPKKVSRVAAEKAWKKVKPEDRATAMAVLDAHVRKWRREHPDTDKFIPHAATWLNGKMWTDVINGHHDPDDTVVIDGVRMDRSAL
jgi:hypothetical protein